MTTLEDLYYDNISPHERYIKRGTREDTLISSSAETKKNSTPVSQRNRKR